MAAPICEGSGKYFWWWWYVHVHKCKYRNTFQHLTEYELFDIRILSSDFVGANRLPMSVWDSESSEIQNGILLGDSVGSVLKCDVAAVETSFHWGSLK